VKGKGTWSLRLQYGPLGLSGGQVVNESDEEFELKVGLREAEALKLGAGVTEAVLLELTLLGAEKVKLKGVALTAGNRRRETIAAVK
jgi:hypothetical protein